MFCINTKNKVSKEVSDAGNWHQDLFSVHQIGDEDCELVFQEAESRGYIKNRRMYFGPDSDPDPDRVSATLVSKISFPLYNR